MARSYLIATVTKYHLTVISNSLDHVVGTHLVVRSRINIAIIDRMETGNWKDFFEESRNIFLYFPTMQSLNAVQSI